MGRPKQKTCTINEATRAFKYAVCELMCEKRKKTYNKCIEEEGGCNSYKVFSKKINE
jgi:hypothetical protein